MIDEPYSDDAGEAYIDEYVQATIHLLHSERRRILLHLLRSELDAAGEDKPVVVDQFELAEEIAAIEDAAHPDAVSGRSVKSCKVSLRRTHLPLLEDNGIIEWWYDDNEVRPTERLRLLGDLQLFIEDAIRDSGLVEATIEGTTPAEKRME